MRTINVEEGDSLKTHIDDVVKATASQRNAEGAAELYWQSRYPPQRVAIPSAILATFKRDLGKRALDEWYIIGFNGLKGRLAGHLLWNKSRGEPSLATTEFVEDIALQQAI